MRTRHSYQPVAAHRGASRRQGMVPGTGAVRLRRVVYSELEDRVARRWYASRRQSRDHVRFPQTVLRAVLLHAESVSDPVWAAAADTALSALLMAWLKEGTPPSQAFARLSELVQCLQSALAQDPIAFAAADLCERCESILLDGFADRWWGLAHREARAATRS